MPRREGGTERVEDLGSAQALARTEYRVHAAEFGRDSEAFLTARAPDSDEASLALGIRLVRAANAFIQTSEREVQRPRGLRWAGFSVLFILRIYQTLEASAISRLTGVSRQAASTVLRTLQREGLVERDQTVTDRRIIPLRLSQRGKTIADDALRGQLSTSEQWFSALDSGERVEFKRLLEKLLVGAGSQH